MHGGVWADLTSPQDLHAGVEDRAVRTTHLWGQSIFSHTSYWTSGGLKGSPNHIEALTDALALFDETEV